MTKKQIKEQLQGAEQKLYKAKVGEWFLVPFHDREPTDVSKDIRDLINKLYEEVRKKGWEKKRFKTIQSRQYQGVAVQRIPTYNIEADEDDVLSTHFQYLMNSYA